MRQGPSGSMSKRSSMRSGRGGPLGRGPLRVPPRVPDRPWDVAQGLMAPSEALFASDFWRSAIFQPTCEGRDGNLRRATTRRTGPPWSTRGTGSAAASRKLNVATLRLLRNSAGTPPLPTK